VAGSELLQLRAVAAHAVAVAVDLHHARVMQESVKDPQRDGLSPIPPPDDPRRLWHPRAMRAFVVIAMLGCLTGCSNNANTRAGASGSGEARQALSINQQTDLLLFYVAVAEVQRRRNHARDAYADAVLQPLYRTCADLKTMDRLVPELRAACRPLPRLYAAVRRVRRCSGPRSCRGRVRATRSAITFRVRALQQADRVVVATRLAPACKQARVTPKARYAALRKGQAALLGLGRALDSGSGRRAAAARRRLAGFDPEPETGTVVHTDRVRAACWPIERMPVTPETGRR